MQWIALQGLARAELPGRGTGSGVYVFRDRRTSDVLYIGQSADVGRRMRDYFDGGVSTRGRIHALLYEEGWADRVEVQLQAVASPRPQEHALIAEYVRVHNALPPWNLRP